MFANFGFIEALPYLCIGVGAFVGKAAGALADADAAGVLTGGTQAVDSPKTTSVEALEADTQQMQRRADAGEALLRTPVPPQRVQAPRARDADEDPNDFTTSMLVGAATHSSLVGSLAGGSLVGAMVGAALTEEREHRDDPIESCSTVDNSDSWSDRDDADSCSSSDSDLSSDD